MEWVLCSVVIFVSMLVGLALGRVLQVCEYRENQRWNAPTNSPEKNQTAPGADWGTWSPTT